MGSAPTLPQSATPRKMSSQTMPSREATPPLRQIPPRASGERDTQVLPAWNSNALKAALLPGEAERLQDSRLGKVRFSSTESRIAKALRLVPSLPQIPVKVVACG